MNPNDFNARIDFLHPLLPSAGLSFPGFDAVLTASTLDEVLPCIRAVEAAAASGCYAVGYLAYEAAPAFDPALRTGRAKLPLAVFGLSSSPATATPVAAGWYRFGEWKAGWTRHQHRRAVDRILAAISAGECYQANLTFPLTTHFEGSIAACYRQLRLAQDADYCGMLSGPDFSVLSVSPELFFERSGDRLRTRPMKGTRRRGLNLEDDLLIAGELSASAKDRAENVMIVDLLRNDLGRIALPGSVAVERLFDIERYPTVWQMTSTISARIHAATSLSDILSALFPCGSITGAPKISTMELLSRLETTPRGPYCGAFGVVLPGGDCVFNVPIRTVILDEGNRKAHYAVGSGVVADSDPGQEYDECLLKARVLERRSSQQFDLFETLGWNAQDGFVRLEGHLGRLRDSAAYFGFRYDEAAIETRLLEAAAGWGMPKRVRLLLSRDGSLAVKATPLTTIPAPITLKLADEAVRSADRFLYHKTTRREVYDRERARLGKAGDAVLHNEHGQVTETTIANIAFRIEGEWVTPPAGCGLLPGVLRGEMIRSGQLKERIVRVEEALRSEELRLLSSLRGAVPACWL